jgi:hypothetical protein
MYWHIHQFMAALSSLKSVSRQVLLFATIGVVCTGVAIAPAQSEEDNSQSQNRQGFPEKVVPGGTYFR